MKPDPDAKDDRTAPEVDDPQRARSDYRVHAFWEGGHARAWLAPGRELVLGRADECDIVVDHSSASRRHARIVANGGLAIEDLGSSNGIRLGGERIPSNTRVRFRAGDLIELGGAIIVVHAPPARIVSTLAPPPMAEHAFERLLLLVAPANINVLLLGETGVGKNVAARRIHELSSRRDGPFVQVNCAALPEPLLEGELFGYERGAFTGAVRAKAGLCEAADGGTLLLDEIGEMPLSTQAKLLGVLDSHEVQRLGSVRPMRVDVRFLAATNRDLEAAVVSGEFRRDLYFRLNAVKVEIPPLRARRDTIASLARSFALETAKTWNVPSRTLSPAVIATLEAHSFPGNVRELKNAIERAFLLARHEPLEPHHFDLGQPPAMPELAASVPAAAPRPADLPGEISALERERIVSALEASGGNQTAAAKALGISRRTLIHRIEEYGLSRPRKR
jgi:two-component system, NtrC family, response regulator AtoC